MWYEKEICAHSFLTSVAAVAPIVQCAVLVSAGCGDVYLQRAPCVFTVMICSYNLRQAGTRYG